MTNTQILDKIVEIYIDAIPETDAKARKKIQDIFAKVKISKIDGLENLYIAFIRANGVLGGKYDALRHFKHARELLETEYDKTYLGSLSVEEKPTYADREQVWKDIVAPTLTANLKAQKVKTQTINKLLRTFKFEDWFWEMSNFIAMNALVYPKFFANDSAFLSALRSQLAQWYVGMIPDTLTFDFFAEIRQAVVEKVINKNFN